MATVEALPAVWLVIFVVEPVVVSFAVPMLGTVALLIAIVTIPAVVVFDAPTVVLPVTLTESTFLVETSPTRATVPFASFVLCKVTFFSGCIVDPFISSKVLCGIDFVVVVCVVVDVFSIIAVFVSVGKTFSVT